MLFHEKLALIKEIISVTGTALAREAGLAPSCVCRYLSAKNSPFRGGGAVTRLSRAAAADLIAAGHVKLRHLPTQRPNARVGEGDAISARGYGRLMIDQVGAPTKKGRLPLRLIRYGASRKH